MTTENSLSFSSAQAVVTAESVEAHASEIHGLLTGLVCAGYDFESIDYVAIVNDMLNNGEGLPAEVKQLVKNMYSDLWQNILDDSFSFQLLLPDDDDAISERGHALSVWVQGFNLGFGMQQAKGEKFSEDVQEVLNDFIEIANLSDELEEDEDTEQAFFEIAEYVRISALLCFSELGAAPQNGSDSKVVH